MLDADRGGVTKQPIRYPSAGEDSARWLDFDVRADDIVISTGSKSGTTWVQMICGLLIFDTPDLPRPLAELSPWLDWLVLNRSAALAAYPSRASRTAPPDLPHGCTGADRSRPSTARTRSAKRLPVELFDQPVEHGVGGTARSRLDGGPPALVSQLTA